MNPARNRAPVSIGITKEHDGYWGYCPACNQALGPEDSRRKAEICRADHLAEVHGFHGKHRLSRRSPYKWDYKIDFLRRPEVRARLSKLTPKQLQVLHLRGFLGEGPIVTLENVGKAMGCSHTNVHYIEVAALRNLGWEERP